MPNLPFPPSVWIILGRVLLFAAVSLLLPFLGEKSQTPPEEGWNGIFYSNPKDSLLFVRKRYGIGYTLNFGNPWCWAVLAIISAMVVAPLLISVVFLRHVPK